MKIKLKRKNTGNVRIFVDMDGVKVLVDAGISARRIKSALAEIGQDIKDIRAIFVTHEHNDHIKGLPSMAKQFGVPIYSRPDTFRAMSCFGDINPECVRAIGSSVRLGHVLVKAFPIPHDAADPVGYSFIGRSKFTVVTDLGIATSTISEALEGSDVAVLEANHDLEMLKDGSYPQSLKQRIMGERGHLSNDAAAWTLVNLKRRPSHVFLAHLSEQNNDPDLALSTVRRILKQQGVVGSNLIMTKQDKCVGLVV